MKTIEERAEEYSVKNWIATNPFVACKDGYIRGATEQQAIDNQQLCEMVLDNQNAIIDKACEIYRKELSEIIGTFNHLGKRLYDIDELGELISLEGSINDFIKAMKGE